MDTKKELARIRMFAFIQGVLLTVVGMGLIMTEFDIGLTAFLMIIAWGGFFVISVKIAQILRR